MVEKVIQLKCYCNEYPWGKQGSQSLAAQLCAKTPGTDFKIDESRPYSEMWMGTYPELPSFVLETGEDLQDVIDKNSKELVGDGVTKKFGHTKIPYLPKVLSIAKALPLQLHPNKELSAKLHKENPSDFTDPNHKPEIALALSDFEAFCGFKPLNDINRLMHLEPLTKYLPNSQEISDDQTLKHLVNTLLKISAQEVAEAFDGLVQLPSGKFEKETYIHDLLPRLRDQYTKEDNGILVALITMNYLKLKAGQSIYIPADGIHAYLSGDIIECMARSNNVLNTGFCPRGDRNSADLFCSVLTFTPHSPQDCMLPPKAFAKSSGSTKLFNPPLSEFSVLATELDGTKSEKIGALNGPSMLIVTKGDGKMKADGKEHPLSEGYIYFIGQGVEVEYDTHGKGLTLFTFFAE